MSKVLGISLNEKQQKTLLWVGVGLVLLYGLAFAAGKSRGKIQVVASVDQSQLRPGFSAAAYALKIQKALSGYNWNPWDDSREKALTEFNTLTDAEIAAVYNYFNRNLSTDGVSLYEYIASEWIRDAIQDVVLARLSRLNLV